MKTLTQTIIALAALSMLTTAFAPAQNVSPEDIGNNVEVRAREAEIAAKAAQKQAESVQKLKKAAQKQAEAAQKRAEITAVLAQAKANQPTMPVLPSASPPALVQNPPTWLNLGTRTGDADMVLVIPSEQTGTEELIAINEDMNVMSRIFEKNLQKAGITSQGPGILLDVPMYRDLLSVRGNNSVQSMYLQDYGVLFLLKVHFPLSPSPDQQQEQEETETEEEGDPVWRQIRQEMYEPGNVRRKSKTDQPEVKYDPEKVENLKTTLIKTLKHAANIRCLNAEESVILTVVGSGESSGTNITAINVTGNNKVIVEEKGPDGKTTMRIVKGDALDNMGLSSPAVLVIRTKKPDIDEFAKGGLDFEKFRQRVQLLSYPLLGRAGGHRNFFGEYYRSSSIDTNVRYD